MIPPFCHPRSFANHALDHVSIARDPIEDATLEAEAVSCSSMKALRAKTHLEDAWTKSMEAVTSYLGDRLARQYLKVDGKRSYFHSCNKRSGPCVEVLHALGGRLCKEYNRNIFEMNWTEYEKADKEKRDTKANKKKGVAPRKAGHGALTKCINMVNNGMQQSTYRMQRYASFPEREKSMSKQLIACLEAGVPLPMKTSTNDEHFRTNPPPRILITLVVVDWLCMATVSGYYIPFS